MAYKRHAQGGRFKAANFGDLGLRAYRELQDRQIKHLKEQNQQDQAYSKQHLQALRGKGAAEIEHNRQLQNFYNSRDDLAIDNTNIRGKREVEAILGEAKEYEKQAKFWKDFSSTYSKQYLEAAGDIYDIATTAQSNHQMTALDQDEQYKKFSQNASKLNNLSSYEGVKIQLKAYEDFRKGKINKEELNDIVGHISEIELRRNSKTKAILLNREIDNWPEEHVNLRSLAKKAGIEWNAKTAGEFYYLRARELMRGYGVDPSSKAGREFLDNVKKLEFDETEKLAKISKANADMQTKAELDEAAKGLVGKSHIMADKSGKVITATGPNYIEYNTNFNNRLFDEGAGYKLDENGRVVEGTVNVHHNFKALMERDIMGGNFASKEQAKNHTINQLQPGAKITHNDDGTTIEFSSKDTWVNRHPILDEEFDEIWGKWEAKVAEDLKNDIKKRDAQAQIDIDRRAKLDPGHKDYINLQDPSTIKNLKNTYHDLPDTLDNLGNFETFAPYNKNGDVTTANLTKLYAAGDLENLNSYLQYMPDDVKADWESKQNQLEVLNRMGLTGAGLTSKAKGILQEILGDEAAKPNALNTEHFQRTIRAIKQDILKTFSDVYETAGEYDYQKIQALDAAIDQKINANGGLGSGIYRRSNTGEGALSTQFLFDIDETDAHPSVTSKEIEKKLSTNEGIENLFNGMENGAVRVKDSATGTEVSKMLISIDDADTAIRSINAGNPIPYNKAVSDIVKFQPKTEGKRQYTRRDVWNKYFESIGFGENYLPAGTIEKAKHDIESSPIQVPDNLSESNSEVVACYSGMVKDGICVPGEPNEEQKKVEKNNEIRSNVGRTLWEYWRNLTPLYKITPN